MTFVHDLIQFHSTHKIKSIAHIFKVSLKAQLLKWQKTKVSSRGVYETSFIHVKHFPFGQLSFVVDWLFYRKWGKYNNLSLHSLIRP